MYWIRAHNKKYKRFAGRIMKPGEERTELKKIVF